MCSAPELLGRLWATGVERTQAKRLGRGVPTTEPQEVNSTLSRVGIVAANNVTRKGEDRRLSQPHSIREEPDKFNTSTVAIVATKNRPQHLINALSSVVHQSRQPNLLIVVREGGWDQEAVERATSTMHEATLVVLPNQRASNLSGAVNTALQYLLRTSLAPRATYVALLDDDDTWEPEYLERCASLVEAQDLDWVVSGIYRHETEGQAGRRQSIPESISASDFLVTNPHVQGSNLFVRLSTLLEAGCFDENLQSTTDRDVCIRLLNLGDTKVGFLREHLVHHMALGHDRLSTPGSPSKRQGLVAFYQKYGQIMSREQRARFLHRATTMFGCAFEDFQPGDSP